MEIIHIINSLKKGGAENNLFRLCKFQKEKYQAKINITIITLIDNGYYEETLKKLGINIFSLKIDEKNKTKNFLNKIFKFRQFMKNQNPDVIQSWMYHSNFITIFLQKKFHDKIFWNIRHSQLNYKYSKKNTILISLICGLFSKSVPKKIMYCSKTSINFHVDNHFYSRKKTNLIYNGFSGKKFYPSKILRSNFRKKNRIEESTIVLGYAGRYSKQKNIYNLLVAFSKMSKNYKNIYLMMAGRDINTQNKELNSFVSNLKINNKVILLDEQKNLIEFYNGIDLLMLTSHSESFPNVLAESMLCSTPVLSSNVGCAKEIVNKFGFILNNNNSESIIMKLEKFLNFFINNKDEWEIFKKKSRLQIEKNFSILKMENSYMQTWKF